MKAHREDAAEDARLQADAIADILPRGHHAAIGMVPRRTCDDEGRCPACGEYVHSVKDHNCDA